MELQNALEDAHATIEEFKLNPPPAAAVAAPVVVQAAAPVEQAAPAPAQAGGEQSFREKVCFLTIFRLK